MSCLSPYYVKADSVDSHVPLPCGKCPPCKKRRVDSWVFRLMEESKVSTFTHFITLTYDNAHLPRSKNNLPTLDKKAFPSFMKRLRKQTGIKNIKYYAVGEYGGLNSRPHYHAIIFNVPDGRAYSKAWSLISKKTQKRVQFGIIDVDQLTPDSAAYVCKYIDKKKRIPMHPRDDRVKEFSLMSKRLGQSYINKNSLIYHRSNPDKLFLVKDGGFRIAMPKYYRHQIWNETERQQQLSIIKNKLDAEEQKLIQELGKPEYKKQKDRYANSVRLQFEQRAKKRKKI